MHLRAFCMACDWSAILDNETLIKKLGRGYGSMPTDLVPVLVCSKCGSKDLAVTLAVNEDEVPKETADHIREVWKNGEENSSDLVRSKDKNS